MEQLDFSASTKDRIAVSAMTWTPMQKPVLALTYFQFHSTRKTKKRRRGGPNPQLNKLVVLADETGARGD